MPFVDDILNLLTVAGRWGYRANGPTATEPTALSALALTSHDEHHAAVQSLDWLVRVQASNGSLGVTATEHTPCWPTALAILAWNKHDDATGQNRYSGCIDRAVRWTLTARGNTTGRKRQIGHDTTLTAWPWVLGTHSWLEPTALFVLALAATGHAEHPRTQEAIRLLVDRLLPNGGANYGNTIVLGQELLPHVQPTGLAMLALANRGVENQLIERSLVYLEQTLSSRVATASLCYGLMGLAAHDRGPSAADDWLASVWQREKLDGASAYKLALLALASLSSEWRAGCVSFPVMQD